jgi:hypothetical protein
LTRLTLGHTQQNTRQSNGIHSTHTTTVGDSATEEQMEENRKQTRTEAKKKLNIFVALIVATNEPEEQTTVSDDFIQVHYTSPDCIKSGSRTNVQYPRSLSETVNKSSEELKRARKMAIENANPITELTVSVTYRCMSCLTWLPIRMNERTMLKRVLC